MALTIQERLKDLRVECGLTLDFKDISHYTLSSGETQTESATQTGTVSTGMGNMGGPGGQKPDGAPPSGGGGGPKPDDDTPRSKPTGEMPQKDSGNAKA